MRRKPRTYSCSPDSCEFEYAGGFRLMGLLSRVFTPKITSVNMFLCVRNVRNYEFRFWNLVYFLRQASFPHLVHSLFTNTMATTSNSTRNIDSGSRRNALTGVSTPVSGASIQFVTPSSSKTSKHGRESAAPAVVPQRRSKRGRDNSAPMKLTAPSKLFRSRDPAMTCFNFPLDPTDFDHLKVICSKCKLVLGEAKHGILTEAMKKKERSNKRMRESRGTFTMKHIERHKKDRHMLISVSSLKKTTSS